MPVGKARRKPRLIKSRRYRSAGAAGDQSIKVDASTLADRQAVRETDDLELNKLSRHRVCVIVRIYRFPGEIYERTRQLDTQPAPRFHPSKPCHPHVYKERYRSN